MPNIRIPQSTTKRAVLKAYLSDGVTEATGKTIAVTISKNGAAFGNPSAGATNATEIASAWYYVDLSTTDTGTLGPLIVRGTATGVDPSEAVFEVAADVATLASILAAVDTEVAAIKAKTDNLPTDPADESAIEAAILSAWTTAATEAYAADGAAATPAQLLYMIWARLAEFAIVGTTITAKKLDGSTTAFTLTLDSATAPTSSTRAT